MSEGKWSVFEDKRYDPKQQICRQCDKYVSEDNEDSFGTCTFLDRLHSPHQLEWAAALSNIICNGFEFRGDTIE